MYFDLRVSGLILMISLNGLFEMKYDLKLSINGKINFKVQHTTGN